MSISHGGHIVVRIWLRVWVNDLDNIGLMVRELDSVLIGVMVDHLRLVSYTWIGRRGRRNVLVLWVVVLIVLQRLVILMLMLLVLLMLMIPRIIIFWLLYIQWRRRW